MTLRNLMVHCYTVRPWETEGTALILWCSTKQRGHSDSAGHHGTKGPLLHWWTHGTMETIMKQNDTINEIGNDL